jgi:tRNA modification GTPase
MQFPSLDDTIVAVSTAWEGSPVGVVRLSGQRAFELAADLGGEPPADTRNQVNAGVVRVCADLVLPAEWYWFHAPRSFTGQSVVEVHTVGNLAALRALGAALVLRGARRALPGEFTSRAYLNARLDAGAVDGVLGLIRAGSAAAARRAARLARRGDREDLGHINEALSELIALVEAGIDFVDEEGVRFISASEARDRIRRIRGQLRPFLAGDRGALARSRPHVALAGLPNAGKSTLFNALLGRNRAIVAPVVGTTRDVLSGEARFGRHTVVLQDTAGLGGAADEIELAAHIAAERAADAAEIVIWVHDRSEPWGADELIAMGRIDAERRVVVASKCDQPNSIGAAGFEGETIEISVVKEVGLPVLRAALAELLDLRAGASDGVLSGEFSAAHAALERAEDLARDSTRSEELLSPELVALELRQAWERIEYVERGPLVETTLGRIYGLFCVGK